MDIEKHILKKFMYNKSLKFNELREDIPSNKFSYHLKRLLEGGIIEKKDDIYTLTSKGTHLISTLDGVNIEKKQSPIVCAFVMGYEDGSILVNKRGKQPFLGYIGLPGGKLDFGNSMPEQAASELLEETGLKAKKLELKLITNFRTINQDTGEFTHHVIGFFYLATGLTGELKDDEREGQNMFMTLEEIKKMSRYPDLDFIIETLLESKQVVFREAERYMKNGEFSGIKFL